MRKLLLAIAVLSTLLPLSGGTSLQNDSREDGITVTDGEVCKGHGNSTAGTKGEADKQPCGTYNTKCGPVASPFCCEQGQNCVNGVCKCQTVNSNCNTMCQHNGTYACCVTAVNSNGLCQCCVGNQVCDLSEGCYCGPKRCNETCAREPGAMAFGCCVGTNCTCCKKDQICTGTGCTLPCDPKTCTATSCLQCGSDRVTCEAIKCGPCETCTSGNGCQSTCDAATQKCDGTSCVDKCVGVSCSTGQICVAGVCQCDSTTCVQTCNGKCNPDTQVCDSGCPETCDEKGHCRSCNEQCELDCLADGRTGCCVDPYGCLCCVTGTAVCVPEGIACS